MHPPPHTCIPPPTHSPPTHNRHLLVHYPATYNRALKARQLATSDDHGLLFHPSGSVVQCFGLLDGKQRGVLRGHFDTVNAVAYNPVLQVCMWGCRGGVGWDGGCGCVCVV